MDVNQTLADLRLPPKSWYWALGTDAQPCRCLWRGFDEQIT
jgi:hypothetical protein